MAARGGKRNQDQQRHLTAGTAPEWVACVRLPQFAVCTERRRQPGLERRPVVLVGPPEDGGQPIVRACSSEARMSGVTLGSAAHEVPQRCASAAILPFDLPHYRQIFDQLVAALEDVSPVVEGQPVEAAYLDLTGL